MREAGGTGGQSIVVGGKVAAAMTRSGAEGGFCSNLHRGRAAEAGKLLPEQRATAMLRANRGAVAMAVNSSPGLEGVRRQPVWTLLAR